jgi:hypothetical protein
MKAKKEKKGEWVENTDYHAISTWNLNQSLTFLSLSEATQRKLPGNYPACDIKDEVGMRIRYLIDIAQPQSLDEIAAIEQRLIVDTTNMLTFLIGYCHPDLQISPIQHSLNYATLQEAIDINNTLAIQLLFYLSSSRKLNPAAVSSSNNQTCNVTANNAATNGAGILHDNNNNNSNNISNDSNNCNPNGAAAAASHQPPPQPSSPPPPVNFLGIQDPNTVFNNNHSHNNNDWKNKTSMPFAFTPKLQQEQLRQTSYDQIATWDLDTCISYLTLSETTQKLLPGSKTPCKVKRTVCKRLDELIDQKAAERVQGKTSFLSNVVSLFNTYMVIIRSACPGLSAILTIAFESFLSSGLGAIKALYEQLLQVIEKIDEARRKHINMLVRVYC